MMSTGVHECFGASPDTCRDHAARRTSSGAVIFPRLTPGHGTPQHAASGTLTLLVGADPRKPREVWAKPQRDLRACEGAVDRQGSGAEAQIERAVWVSTQSTASTRRRPRTESQEVRTQRVRALSPWIGCGCRCAKSWPAQSSGGRN